MSGPRHVTLHERPHPMADVFVPRRVPLPRAAAARGALFSVLALVVSAVFALSHRAGTFSYYADSEGSKGDTLAAAPLAFTVSADHTDATLVAGEAGEPFVLALLPTPGSLPIEYTVSAKSATGSTAFCDSILASGAAPLPLNALAESFTAGPATTPGAWTLTLTLPADSPGVVDGMVCTLVLAYNGYQAGGTPDAGYHDEQEVTLTLHADPPAPAASAPVVPTLEVLEAPPLDDSTGATTTGEEATTTEEEPAVIEDSAPPDETPPPQEVAPEASLEPQTPPADPPKADPPTDTTPTDPPPTS